MSDDELEFLVPGSVGTDGLDIELELGKDKNGKKHSLNKSSILLRAGVTTVFYPVEYVKTLMQIGYEPIYPLNSVTLLGRRCLLLPNSFNYIQYIKKVDGLVGCFRGLGPKLVQQSVFMYVNQLMGKLLKVSDDEGFDDSSDLDSDQITLSSQLGEGDNSDSSPVEIVTMSSSRRNSSDDESGDIITWHVYINKLCQDWCCRMVGLVVSFPFQVIAVRTVAEFVGREENFSTGFLPGISQIYEDGGILGFFHGLIPRLIGDSIHLFACGVLRYIIRTQVYCEELRACMGVSTSILVGSLTYPFTVVSNTVIVSGAKHLAMGQPPLMPNYKNWLHCWNHLSSLNLLRRGSSIFFRYYSGPRIVTAKGLVVPTGVPFGPDLYLNKPVIVS